MTLLIFGLLKSMLHLIPIAEIANSVRVQFLPKNPRVYTRETGMAAPKHSKAERSGIFLQSLGYLKLLDFQRVI